MIKKHSFTIGYMIGFFTLYSLFILTASAQAKDANPNDPALFFTPLKQDLQHLHPWGPGHGPQRLHSKKPDVHDTVSGYTPARRCLTCHEGQQNNLHYARTQLICRDCHISKPIAGIRNPNAAIYAPHRYEQVCAKCHEGAGPGMGSYVIHERPPWSQASQESFPALYWSTWVMLFLAGSVFALFLPYIAAWWWREIKQRKAAQTQPPTPITKGPHMARFSPFERGLHTLLVICFMLLSITGVAWMYVETDLGNLLNGPLGGYQNAVQIHRLFGLLLMATFVIHIIHLLKGIKQSNAQSLSGPDSLVWSWQDFRAFYHHLKWVVGLAPHPVFDRWTWWQKFDYWAVWWGLVIVGSTGMMLFDTVLTAQLLPGWTMNVARWIHKIEAILAMGHIFVVHFFIESYRPHAFPLKDHIFHGATSLEHLKHEHPQWVERLEAQGDLKEHYMAQPPRMVQIAFFGFAISMVLLGLFLLFAMLFYAIDLSI
ncbi:formate dehydrogenase subunit gamma [Magnetococcus sp. PR-3]|uniref:formate dehydrogenase subunit gamma n=1 Tax=Magnetococcus sp. PR-3 TaxID=3120355 RepID=UPI002FCE3242